MNAAPTTTASKYANPHQHEHQLNESSSNSNNIAAQRAAAESLSISQSVLSTTITQGEQLQHSHELMDRQSYVMKKSDRLVRGMTWSGWIANAFSKDVAPPTTSTMTMTGLGGGGVGGVVRGKKESRELSRVIAGRDGGVEERGEMEDIPPHLQQLQMTIQNYHCNVLLLKQCNSQAQLDTCIDVCRALNNDARRSLDTTTGNGFDRTAGGSTNSSSCGGGGARERQVLRKMRLLLEDVEAVQSASIQTVSQQLVGFTGTTTTTTTKKDNNQTMGVTSPSKKNYSSGSSSTSDGANLFQNAGNKQQISKYTQQEQHLSVLSSNLEELQYMGNSIGSELQGHNELLNGMEGHADDLIDQTKMVVRRADRISQRSIWRSVKSDFKCWVMLQHLPSNRYLTVLPHRTGNTVSLEEDFRSDSAIFGVYTRQKSESTIGLLNKCTNRWMGQSMLFGSIACSASRFGYREEWELDDAIDQNNEEFELDDSIARNTKMLCCCANGGQGGWLNVDETSGAFRIADFDIESKNKAPVWSVVVLDDEGKSG